MLEYKMRAKLILNLDRWAERGGMTDQDLKEDFEWLIDEWAKKWEDPKYKGNKYPDFALDSWEVEVGEPERVED
jgi:hypothetical protein